MNGVPGDDGTGRACSREAPIDAGAGDAVEILDFPARCTIAHHRVPLRDGGAGENDIVLQMTAQLTVFAQGDLDGGIAGGVNELARRP